MYVSCNLLCKFLSACVDKVDVHLVPLKVGLVVGEVGADVVGSLCLHIQSGIHASFRLRGSTSHPSLAYLVIAIHVISLGTRFCLSYAVAVANIQAFSLLQLGVGAIEAVLQGQRNIMVGIRNDQVVYVPFVEAVTREKPISMELIKVLNELSI